MELLASRASQREPHLVDLERARSAISRLAGGVSVITTRQEGIDYGLTASAVTPVSFESPTLLICLNKTSNTRDAIAQSGVFAVNILREEQSELARRFARSEPNKFADLSLSYGELDVPLLENTLASIECRVIEEVSIGTHSVFFAEMQTAQATEGMPLTYFRGRMGRFTDLGIDTRAALWKYMRWEDGD